MSRAAHHISVRTLNRLFHAESTTLGDWIRTRRLERCPRELTAPHLRHRTIGAIAARWGYTRQPTSPVPSAPPTASPLTTAAQAHQPRPLTAAPARGADITTADRNRRASSPLMLLCAVRPSSTLAWPKKNLAEEHMVGVTIRGAGMAQLKSLEPQLIGGAFRSSAPVGIRWAMRLLRRMPRSRRGPARVLIHVLYWPITAKTRILLISLVALATLLGLAQAGGVLGPSGEGGERWALACIFSDDDPGPGGVSLSLLQDVAGLIVLAVVLVTPFFCCQQVQAIAEFVQMNERNGGVARLRPRQIRRHDALVRRTNACFRVVGLRSVSAAIAVAMAAGAASLYVFVNTHGLMETWNPTALPDSVWRDAVYAGWWANWHAHPEMAVALCVVGTYAFYFLVKQLAMGVVFTAYLYRSAVLGFGVTPNMKFDSDGFQGLRPLRRFMLWTYGSALAHMIGLLVLFMVWLPAKAWMVFIVLGVMLVDMAVIVLPSSIGYHFALEVKKKHVESLHQSALEPEERDAATARIWAVPVLPVTTRRAVTGIGLYVLAPAVSALFPVVYQHL